MPEAKTEDGARRTDHDVALFMLNIFSCGRLYQSLLNQRICRNSTRSSMLQNALRHLRKQSSAVLQDNPELCVC